MAPIDANTIQKLWDQIDALKDSIETAGDEKRKMLNSIKIQGARGEVSSKDGKFDETAWSALSEGKKEELLQLLVLVRNSLDAIANPDGPANPKHIMYAEYASNTFIICWGAHLEFVGK